MWHLTPRNESRHVGYAASWLLHVEAEALGGKMLLAVGRLPKLDQDPSWHRQRPVKASSDADRSCDHLNPWRHNGETEKNVSSALLKTLHKVPVTQQLYILIMEISEK